MIFGYNHEFYIWLKEKDVLIRTSHLQDMVRLINITSHFSMLGVIFKLIWLSFNESVILSLEAFWSNYLFEIWRLYSRGIPKLSPSINLGYVIFLIRRLLCINVTGELIYQEGIYGPVALSIEHMNFGLDMFFPL